MAADDFFDRQTAFYRELAVALLKTANELHRGAWREIRLRAAPLQPTQWRVDIDLGLKDGTAMPLLPRAAVVEGIRGLYDLCTQQSQQSWIAMDFRVYIGPDGQVGSDCHYSYEEQGRST